MKRNTALAAPMGSRAQDSADSRRLRVKVPRAARRPSTRTLDPQGEGRPPGRFFPLRAADRTILPGERPPTEICVNGHLTNLRVGARGTGPQRTGEPRDARHDRRRGGVVCAPPPLPIRFNPAMLQRGALDRRGGLLDVEVDAEKQERPQHDCQQR